MKLFNAKLEVLNAVATSASEWTLDALVIDNSGLYIAYHAKVGDVVYCYGLSQETFELFVCRYKVYEIQNVSGVAITCSIRWDEQGTNYADPQSGMDAMIGQVLQSGMTAITTIENGISHYMVGQARNIDLDVAQTSSRANDVCEKFIIDETALINRELQASHNITIGSETVTMNGLPINEGTDFDYILVESRIAFNICVELTDGDIFSIRYQPA